MARQAPSAIPKTFSLVAVPISRLPSIEVLISNGENLLQASTQWKSGKKFADTETSTFTEDSRRWFCRSSRFRDDQVSFDELWGKLGRNKLENEKRFKSNVKEVTRIKYFTEFASVWTIYFACAPPFSPRVFTEYHVIRLNDLPPQGRTGTMVSIPVDLSSSADMVELEESGVRGRRVQAEWIRELGEGVLEWRMVICEDLGGILSKLCAKRRVQERFAKDVRSFCLWILRTTCQQDSNAPNKVISTNHGETTASENVQDASAEDDEIQIL